METNKKLFLPLPEQSLRLSDRGSDAATKDKARYRNVNEWKVDLDTLQPRVQHRVNEVTRAATREPDVVPQSSFPVLQFMLAVLTIFLVLMVGWGINQILN